VALLILIQLFLEQVSAKILRKLPANQMRKLMITELRRSWLRR